MITEVIKVNPKSPSVSAIKKAAEIIKKGGLVALPTDTVYGLSCDATNSQAVAKVFFVKKRPLSQPLSIAVGEVSDMDRYIDNFTQSAKILAKKFLPGPLTLVLEKSQIIPDIVTAGRSDVGIRVPDCKVVLMLLRYAKVPIVIPSANLHNKLSPSTAQEVLNYFDGKIDLVIDGGKTKYGQESTIVWCVGDKIKILREGVISKQDIFSSLSRLND